MIFQTFFVELKLKNLTAKNKKKRPKQYTHGIKKFNNTWVA